MKKTIAIKSALYIMLFGILIFFDQYTKHLATLKLKDNAPFVILDNIFEFHYLNGGNQGAAWGLLSGKINFFIILTSIICLFIIYLIARIQIIINKSKMSALTANLSKKYRKYTYLQIILVVLLGGAVGNLIDRSVNGYVVDFLYFKLINFPIFNVADCYVTISAMLLIIICLFGLSEDDFANVFSLKKIKQDKG